MKLLNPHIAGSEANALVFVSGSDPFALGHYPSNPIFPGVLIAEHFCTLARMLCSELAGRCLQAQGIKRIQYLEAIVPGDVVEIAANLLCENDGDFVVAARATVAGKAKARAAILCGNAAAGPLETRRPPQATLAGEHAMEHRDLVRVLPHRYPFLLVDRISDYEPGSHIAGIKLVSSTLPGLLGMAAVPYPQGLVIESIGQLGIALFFLSRADSRPVDIVLGSISGAEFRSPVPVDAMLVLNARIDRQLPNGVVLSGEARQNDHVVTRVDSLVAMVDPRHAAL